MDITEKMLLLALSELRKGDNPEKIIKKTLKNLSICRTNDTDYQYNEYRK